MRERFDLCAKSCEDLENNTKGGGSESGRDLRGEILACVRMVETLALFSDNEDKDDIVTSSLKYLLLPYYLGVCYMHRLEGDRLENVNEALVCFRSFVRNLADKELLEDKIKKFEGRMDGSATFTFGREERIALYRQQKELKAAMTSLSRLEEDEENARSISLLQINCCAMSAYQHYASLQKEVELLKFQKENSDFLPRQAAERAQVQEKMFESLKGAATALQADRERFARGVFKPSHILPTMTVEEFGMLELERMKQAEDQKANQPKGEKQKCCSDDDQ